MELINIYPIRNQYEMLNNNMQMALTHLVEKYPRYKRWVKDLREYKILDNSLIELGEATSLERTLQAAREIDADEIVLPDVFQEGGLTVDMAETFLRDHKEELKDFKVMAVVHGYDEMEWMESFHKLNNMDGIDVLGIPKVLTKQFRNTQGIDGRAYMLNKVIDAAKKEIHLLGLWEGIEEFNDHKDLSLIRSCDTSLFVLYDVHEKDIDYRRNPEFIIDLEEDVMVTNRISEGARKDVQRIVEDL